MSDERRVVTVLFADVTGSTALGETLDPEDLRALLSRYYAIAKEVVAAHGGTVEKFIGDAVMAVFGLRRAHGDDAVRALSAAIELRDRVQSDTRLGERMPIRLGVNTGDVIASRDPGSDDFLVTGDAVNVAARIQQNATAWSIVAGERTVRAARSEFRFGAPEQVEAKGKSAPLLVSELLGRANSSAGRTPIFGRDADLAQMDLVARRAFDERRPFLVSIIAPAGTGKTRLLEEFLVRVRATAPDARVAVAQCLPYGQRLTYWPLRAVLFRICGIDEDAAPDEIRETVDAWLKHAEVEDAREVGRLLVSTVGAGESEVSDRTALFSAWRTFVEAASRQTPLVVAVEDLHWSSDTLLDLFESVLQPRGDTRALLIALARPELLDRRPTWGGGRRNHVSIALEPLDDGATADLVRTYAEGASDDLVNQIVARAEGNPFFAGEIVNAVLERVRSFDDPAEVQGALERLPDTVQATVLARLDELPEDEREVLRVGSVFGRSFRPPGVAALLAGETEAVSDIAERLAERDLVRPTGADGYAFRHILIREVAYSTLSRATRAKLHGAAGRWLEERAAGREEALAELVAYHFREAATLATAMDLDDAATLRNSARIWLIRAAEAAAASAANIEARGHLLAAIEFADADELPELYEALGDVEIGGTPIMLAYHKSLELGQKAGRNADFQLNVLAKQLSIEMRALGSVTYGRSAEEVDATREEGRDLLGRSSDLRSRARFLSAEAFYPFWLRSQRRHATDDQNEQARADATEAAELARELGDANLESAALDALASLAQENGDWQEVIELARRRIEMGNRLLLVERIDAYSLLVWAGALTGDFDLAERESDVGLALVQPGQVPDWIIHLLAWRAVALHLRGKWDAAIATVDQAHIRWAEAGRPSAGYAVRGFAAGMVIATARRDERRAQLYSSIIEEIAANRTDRARYAQLRHLYQNNLPAVEQSLQLRLGPQGLYEQDAMTLAALSDVLHPVAPDALNAGLETARARNVRMFEAEILRAIGLFAPDGAALAEAHSIFAAASALPFEARTRCELALLEGDRASFDAGLATLESVGDVVQVERYLKRWGK